MPKPTEPTRVEVNPGEWFMMDPGMILVKEYETVFAHGERIGVKDSGQGLYLMTFTGRVNNSDETRTCSLAFSPEEGFQFLTQMLDQYEWLADQIRQSRHPARRKPAVPTVPRFRNAKKKRKRK